MCNQIVEFGDGGAEIVGAGEDVGFARVTFLGRARDRLLFLFLGSAKKRDKKSAPRSLEARPWPAALMHHPGEVLQLHPPRSPSHLLCTPALERRDDRARGHNLGGFRDGRSGDA